MATDRILTTSEMNLLRRLERLPMTWVQGRLLVMGGLGYTFDAANNASLGFILPPVSRVFSLNDQLTGLMASSVMIGYLFGAFLAGMVVAALGPGRGIGIDGLTYLVSAWFLWRLRPSAFRGRGSPVTGSPGRALAMEEAAAGSETVAPAGLPGERGRRGFLRELGAGWREFTAHT